jgi:hypothetical protein
MASRRVDDILRRQLHLQHSLTAFAVGFSLTFIAIVLALMWAMSVAEPHEPRQLVCKLPDVGGGGDARAVIDPVDRNLEGVDPRRERLDLPFDERDMAGVGDRLVPGRIHGDPVAL